MSNVVFLNVVDINTRRPVLIIDLVRRLDRFDERDLCFSVKEDRNGYPTRVEGWPPAEIDPAILTKVLQDEFDAR